MADLLSLNPASESQGFPEPRVGSVAPIASPRSRPARAHTRGHT